MTFKLQFDTHGNIIQRITVLPEMEVPDFEDAPEWLDFNTEAYKNAEGEIAVYTEAQLEAKASRPPHPAIWSNETMAWVDTRGLEELKLVQRGVIKDARNANIATPKMTTVGLFDADEVSQNNLNKVIALVRLGAAKGYPAAANYTMATNERREFSLSDLETAAFEIGYQVQQIFDIADTLYQQIDAATTKAEVEAVRWPE